MEIPDNCCTTTSIAFAVILLSVIYYFFKNRNILPGPSGVPYLGLYPFLSEENFQQKLAKYKKVYGDVFSFTYSGRLFISVGSVKALRELHMVNSDCFADRLTDYNVLTCMLGKGVTMINGEPWKILRKFFIQRFRDYGLNTVRDNMVGPMYDSLHGMIDDLKALEGKPVSIFDMLGQRCAVTMRKVIFGEDGVSEAELEKMCSAYSEALDGMMGIRMLLMGPFARLIFAIDPECRRALQKYRDLAKLLFTCSKRIEQSMNEEHPTCITEDYYKERNQRRRNNDPTWEFFSDDTLVDSVSQFVGDGIVGIAAFIGLFLNALTTHAEEQEKLYTELMEVVGPNRQPVLEDRSNLPYVSAFMSEVLRESTFVPVFPSLECTKETTIRGYRIPKGSITLLNFWSAHYDKDTFDDPETFKPSRYMPEPGKPKAESPITFGMGKRSCSGESFVISQSFLFLATIVKNFKIVSSNISSNKSTDYLLAGKFELTFCPRVEN